MASSITTALVERFRAWQEPGWGLRPLLQHSPGYVVWWLFVVIVTPVVGLLALELAGVPLAVIDLPHLAAAAGIMALLSLIVFRASDTVTHDPVVGISLGLVFMGRPAEAILVTVVSMFATPIRKPLVPHLVMLNAAGGAGIIAIAAAVFHVLADGAAAGSGQWLLAAVATFLVYMPLEIVPFLLTPVVGGYEEARPVLRGWVTSLPTHLRSVLPLTVLMALMMAPGDVWRLVFLLVPVLMTYEIFTQAERVVDVQRLAVVDPLTGLRNRRALEDDLESLGIVDPRSKRANWLLMCDLDDFKRLNDTHGHAAGDAALVLAAEQIRSSVRSVDVCARFGGEEFVVILRDVDHDEVASITERLRANVERALAHMGSTVSIGVHGVAPGELAEHALDSADRAMYHSKTNGKNRVTFFESLGAIASPETAAAA